MSFFFFFIFNAPRMVQASCKPACSLGVSRVCVCETGGFSPEPSVCVTLHDSRLISFVTLDRLSPSLRWLLPLLWTRLLLLLFIFNTSWGSATHLIIVERCAETGNMRFSGGWGDLSRGRGKIKQLDLITHARHVKAVVSGPASSLLGFSFASREAPEMPLRPLPCWQAACWHAHLGRFTKTEQIVGIKEDDNVCSAADQPQFNTCREDKPGARERDLRSLWIGHFGSVN